MVALLALVGVAFALGEVHRRRDPERALLRARDVLARVVESPLEHEGAGRRLELRLEGERGLIVDAWLQLPEGPGPHPVIVILGGQRTGRRSLQYVTGERPLAMMALDYPYRRERKPTTWREHLGEGRKIHRALFETVPAVMLALDHLVQREDIDAQRIVLLGGSLGALFAPAVAALDERVAALGLLFGAGDLGALAAANLKAPAPVRVLAGWAVGSLAAPLEPLTHIGAVSPRPVLLINGFGDERMPVELAQRLQDAAGAHCRARWLDVGHVNLKDPRFHDQVLDELVDWLVDLGVLGS